ncbi:MAG: CvpA family protein [Candidatus Magasanikbacteria bacterium]|jgi:membrane protein required for colicin V production
MPVSYFDFALIIIIASFGLFGLWFGLVHTIGSLVGTVAGVYLAGVYYEPVANWLINTTGWGANFSKVLMFIIVFFVINRLVGLVFWLVDKFLSIFTHLPFIHSIDRLLGMIFGLLEGALMLGIIFYFIGKFPVGVTFMGWVTSSKIIPAVVKMASILWPLLPDALKSIQGVIPGIK